MPRKTKTADPATAALPSIPKELIDQFVTGPMRAEAVQSASMAFKKALIERALGGGTHPPPGLSQRRCQAPLGVLPDGSRDIRGLWIENTEAAKFWMKVFNDLKARGVTTS